MADLSVVHRTQPAGPATHVLVIGVGKYPHLVDGDGPLLAEHQNLGQLTSPPESARAIAGWFVESFNNPKQPIGSVRLLISEKGGKAFKNSKSGQKVAVPSATIAEIDEAFNDWLTEGDTHEDNILIFYFCGHGLARGVFTALLAEDFGKKPKNALDGAIDFYRNHLGMSSVKAKQQLYLIDACRTPAKMTQSAEDYAGRVFVQPTAKAGTISKPVFYSTLYGQQAYGREGVPSHFAEALVTALRGSGSDRTQGDWRVRTSSLRTAIEGHMARRVRAGLASAQIPVGNEMTTFDLHYLTGKPDVPVIVSCNPEDALSAARLRCLAGGIVLHERPPGKSEWELALPVGKYDFEALFDAGPYKGGSRPDEDVYPPELNVPVPVMT